MAMYLRFNKKLMLAFVPFVCLDLNIRFPKGMPANLYIHSEKKTNAVCMSW